MAGIKPTESKPVPLGFPVQILVPIADISKKIWALALYFLKEFYGNGTKEGLNKFHRSRINIANIHVRTIYERSQQS